MTSGEHTPSRKDRAHQPAGPHGARLPRPAVDEIRDWLERTEPNDELSIRETAAFIDRYPVLTAVVLRHATSIGTGLQVRHPSIVQAVALLGVRKTLAIVRRHLGSQNRFAA